MTHKQKMTHIESILSAPVVKPSAAARPLDRTRVMKMLFIEQKDIVYYQKRCCVLKMLCMKRCCVLVLHNTELEFSLLPLLPHASCTCRHNIC